MRHLPLLFLLALSACYHPLYGDKPLGEAPTAQEQKLNAVFLGAVDGEKGQKLRNLLIDRMYGQGRPLHADTTLNIELSTIEENLGLQKNAVTARARLTVSVVYTLVDNATRKPLFTGKSRSIVSYNTLDEQYATLASKEDAYTRALTEIADRMVNRLLLYFDSGK